MKLPPERKLRPEPGPLLRAVWIAAGSAGVGIGVLGVFLPLLPTTPFLLFAAACYLKSSPRLHHWLLTNRWSGEYIRNYQQGRGMPMRAKLFSIALLWSTLLLSAYVVEQDWVRWILALVGIGVPLLILRVPTLRDG